MIEQKNNKRILIIGASVLQLPAILKAKEMGYYVGVLDYNPNAVGIKYADQYFNVSTIDVEGVTKVAQSFKPEGIMTLATDMPMRSIAVACEECHLPGISYETAIKATDKGEMIKAFEEKGVEHPWYHIVENADRLREIMSKINYPCIIKPTDNAGSRGVVLVHNQDELVNEYEYSHNASRSGNVIVEEYMRGPEFSIEVMVIDGEPNVLQVTDKLTTGAPHFVEMGHSQPSREADKNLRLISDLAVRACKAIGINTGPAHVEIILTEDGPKMVELGARLGGDCITTHLVPLSTGIDMVAATIESACGQKPSIDKKISKGSAMRCINSSIGIIKEICGVEETRNLPGVKDIILAKGIGDETTKIGSSIDRVGYVVAQGDTAEEAVSICEKALQRISIVVEPIEE